MTIYLVFAIGHWLNDDINELAIIGVYATREEAEYCKQQRGDSSCIIKEYTTGKEVYLDVLAEIFDGAYCMI